MVILSVAKNLSRNNRAPQKADPSLRSGWHPWRVVPFSYRRKRVLERELSTNTWTLWRRPC